MKTAFKSSQPEVLAQWEAFRAEAEEVSLRRREFEVDLGVESHRLLIRRRPFGHATDAVGISAESYESLDPKPEGWRILKRDGYATPNPRSNAGKVWVERLRACTSPESDFPGMPQMHMAETGGFQMAIHLPAIWLWEGTVYAGWDCTFPEEPKTADEVPPVAEVWESIPLSEYYAAREAYDAHHEAKEAVGRG